MKRYLLSEEIDVVPVPRLAPDPSDREGFISMQVFFADGIGPRTSMGSQAGCSEPRGNISKGFLFWDWDVLKPHEKPEQPMGTGFAYPGWRRA